MYENIDQKTRVGAFVLAGGILALLVVISFGHMNPFTTKQEASIVFQNSINGLSVGAPVNFRGVKVGSVKNISLRFDPVEHKAYIPVVLDMETDKIHIVSSGSGKTESFNVKDLVNDGLRAELDMASLVTGESNIELDFQPNIPADLHANVTDLPEIPVHLSTFEKLKNSLADLPLKDIGRNLNLALSSITRLANEDASPFLKSANITAQSATKAINDLDNQLDITLSKLDKFLDSGTNQINGRGQDLHVTLTTATSTLNSIQGIIGPHSVNRAYIDATLRDIAAAAASLRGFSGDIERNPQLLLIGRH